MTDQVDRILQQWHVAKPGLDVSPMAVIGRLSRATSAVDQRIAATLARHGLDPSTFDVLATLLRSGPAHQLTPVELARDAMISTSAVAQRLKKIEQLGYITRQPSPVDGRGTLVALTPSGIRIVESALPEHVETERAVLGVLTSDEQRQLATLLQKISDSAVGATVP